MAGIKLAIQVVNRNATDVRFVIAHQDTTVLPRNYFDKKFGVFRIRSAAVPDISGLTFYVRGHETEADDRECIVSEDLWPDLVRTLIMFNKNFTNNSLTEEDVVWPA